VLLPAARGVVADVGVVFAVGGCRQWTMMLPEPGGDAPFSEWRCYQRRCGVVASGEVVLLPWSSGDAIIIGAEMLPSASEDAAIG
jgi:hypothetical protein